MGAPPMATMPSRQFSRAPRVLSYVSALILICVLMTETEGTLIPDEVSFAESVESASASGRTAACEKSAEDRIHAICGEAKATQKQLALFHTGCGSQNAAPLAAAKAALLKAKKNLAAAKQAQAEAHGYAKAESDEAAWDHLEALSTLKELNERCAVAASTFTKASSAFVQCVKKVKTSTAEANRICSAEEAAKQKAEEEKKKLQVQGPTFKFHEDPCKGGSGSFTMKLKFRQRVNVGVIPSNQFNVKVELRTDKDIDAEMWSTDSTVAIIAWKCKKHNKRLGSFKHKTCIDSAHKQTKTVLYGNATLQYSGYMGTQDMFGYNFGHENIHVIGKSSKPLLVKAFAYEVGTARVKYSWGVDKETCAKKRAATRKERLAKYNAKAAAKTKFKEAGFKAVKWVLAKSNKNCASAGKAVDLATKKLDQAEATKSLSADRVARCRKEKARNKAAVAALKKHRAQLAKKHKKVLNNHLDNVEDASDAVDKAEKHLTKVKKETKIAVGKCHCKAIKKTAHTFEAAKKDKPKKQAAVVRQALLRCLAKNRGQPIPPQGPCKKTGAKAFCSGWSTRYLSKLVLKLLMTSTPHCPAPNLNWRQLQLCISERTMLCVKKSHSLPVELKKPHINKCFAEMLRKQTQYKSCMTDISDLKRPQPSLECAKHGW